MKKILVYGIGTYRNRGVEAIVNSTVNQISDDYSITVANLDNEYNNQFYKDKVKKYISHLSKNVKIEETYSKDHDKLRRIQEDLINEIPKNDIIISAGGDNYSYNVGDWLYVIGEKAKENNKKIILWGASILEKIDDIKLIEHMNLYDALYIRESISYNALKPYVDERKMILGPDPAFSLKASKIELDPWYKDRKVIGINLSPFTINQQNEQAYDAIIELIKYILKETDYSISLIPHVIKKESNDIKIHRFIKKEFPRENRIFVEKDGYNCSEIKYIISQCEMMIVSRTHASIAAYSQCIPTLVLGYSVKSKGIAKDLFGSYEDYVLPYEKINNNSIIDKFIWLNNNKDKIKQRLNDIMPNIIKEASQMFNKVIELMDKNSDEIICPTNQCTGCGLCKKSCPNNAITYEKDKLGFIYPVINQKKCTHCNMCKVKCPINKQIILNKKLKDRECYAFKSLDNELRKKSTSGGFFGTIAESFIKKMKGSIYGVINDNNETKHIRIDNSDDLIKILGSKYTQSNITNIYKELDEDISNDKYILFCGTPCQIAAIKRYTKDYNKIFLVSVICMGVMNDQFIKQVLSEKGYKQNAKILYRRKDYGWSNPHIKIVDSKKTTIMSHDESIIMTSYLNKINLRKSCYNCHYKGDNNVSDIIIGDYWGGQNQHQDMYDLLGVSAVIIRSMKGKKLLKELNIDNKIKMEKTDYLTIEKSNPMISVSAEYNIDRYNFEKCNNLSSLEQLLDTIKIKKELINSEERGKELEKIIDNSSKINEELRAELNNIVNSKRWKLMDKTVNIINRLLGKK